MVDMTGLSLWSHWARENKTLWDAAGQACTLGNVCRLCRRDDVGLHAAAGSLTAAQS